MSTDLNKLSVAELKALAEKATSMISSRQEDEIKAGYEKVEQIASDLNLSVEELVERGRQYATRKTTTRKPVEPRYRNPDNAQETWTGRGKQPRWLAAKVSAGAALEDFLISK